MEIKLSDITLEFFKHDISNKKQLAVMCSSGTDSTILLYLTALRFPDRKILPYHIEESQYPKQKPALIKNINLLNQKLPNSNLLPLLSDYVDYCRIGSEWRLKAKEEPGELPPRRYGNEGQAKILANRHYIEQRFRDGSFDYLVSGATSNPPKEVLEELGCPYEERRSNRKAPRIFSTHYDPFYHIHKGHIAELWKKYDIMDLFNNTITCIEYREEIEKPCKVCYFCSEKKWAFGKYDGGIV